MKEPTYKIISINHADTNQPRLDRKYPQQIGKFCRQPIPIIGRVMYVEYIGNEDLLDFGIRTSLVQSVSEYGNTIKITTLNSVYEFEKVED